ncbi:MAG: iron-sulfur cluster assembly accessory protein [Bacteroidetes bacterium]|jgi:iron-sulfur cluster assembly protein|nr:iron-sulfur cluster assembly accessory protein [Bacteroidota bacterium]
MIAISDQAAAHVMRLREQAGLGDDYALRVSVNGGGCSGLSYHLDFDNEVQPGDQVFQDHGITMRVNLKSYLYLAGTELTYSDGLQGKGFHFNNPNASRACGCGESFAV